MPPGLSDEQRLKAIRAGDERAFLELYREHQGGIYRFALRMSGEAALAEDVVQEVFMTLIGSADSTYDPQRGSLGGYLFGVARNLVRRRLALRGRWISFIDDKYDQEPQGSASYSLHNPKMSGDLAGDPLVELTRQETIESVRQAILALPEHYREAIVLCDLHEMRYQEAAQILDCSLGTVRSRLHRGRLLLLDRLRGEGGRADAGVVKPE
jgi:RNA polymerase sigma-70 factor (ECF subfamily)